MCAIGLGLCTPRASSQQQSQEEAPASSELTASISGHVFRADTGAPLGKAIVTIEHVGMYPSGARVIRTDADGAYRFTELDSGTYTVTANHIGFAGAEYSYEKIQADGMNATWLHVEAGQSLPGIDVTLSACTPKQCPPATTQNVTGIAPKNGWIISGTIRDEDGDLFDGYLAPVHVKYLQGGDMLDDSQVLTQIATDEQGNFQITGGGTDTFYLAAIGVGAHGDAYTTVYCPDALSFDAAQKFSVSPGTRIADVHIVFKTVPTFTIRGKIAERDPGAASQDYAITYRNLDTDSTGWIHDTQASIARPDGSFTIRGLQPGEYSLAVGQSRRSLLDGTVFYTDWVLPSLGRAEVRVTNADVQLTIPVGGPTDINGTVTLDGEPQSRIMVPYILVGLGRYRSGPGRPGNGQVLDGLHFRLRGIVPGTYTLSLDEFAPMAAYMDHQPMQLPESFPVYIKHVECGGVDYTEKPFTIEPGVPLGGCQVTLAKNPATITGTVQQAGTHAPDSVVVLIPQSQDLRQHPDYIRTAEAAADGRFAIPRVIPGDYFLFAVPPDKYTGYFAPHFADINQSSATPITIHQNETLSVNPARFVPR
jgi:hypothetical protein